MLTEKHAFYVRLSGKVKHSSVCLYFPPLCLTCLVSWPHAGLTALSEAETAIGFYAVAVPEVKGRGRLEETGLSSDSKMTL